MCLFCAVALGGEGRLDKCFLPTEGRDADVVHKLVKELSPSRLYCTDWLLHRYWRLGHVRRVDYGHYFGE